LTSHLLLRRFLKEGKDYSNAFLPSQEGGGRNVRIIGNKAKGSTGWEVRRERVPARG